MATAANQVWSWDITKLRGPVKWTYYHLYVILDIFSRYVVGWMVASRESAALAEVLIHPNGRQAGHRARPADYPRRPWLLDDLQAGGLSARRPRRHQSHSRPHVSDDNPYCEAGFKTMKYRPDFPGQFASIESARAHCQVFFPWYNEEHRHIGLGLHTPADVHYRTPDAIRDKRVTVLDDAYRAHPKRFVRKPPEPPQLPTHSWINPPDPPEETAH